MGAKATFNPITRIIKLTEAPSGPEGLVFIDVQIDLYSDMKEDWLNNASLRKFHPPIRVVGGDPLPGSKTLGDTYFLRSDWKIEPYDADQRLTVEGNLYSEDGTSPFIKPTGGSYSVQIERSVSNLVDSTIAQLPEIQFSSYRNAVCVDILNLSGKAVSGSDYPAGTSQFPVDNFSDAFIISQNVGLRALELVSDATLLSGLDFSGFRIFGINKEVVTLTVESGAIIDDCVFNELTLTGYFDANSFFDRCRLQNLTMSTGDIHYCETSGILKILGDVEIYDSYSVTLGASNFSTFDLNNENNNVAIHRWSGHIKIINMFAGGVFEIGCVGGAHIEIDSTVSSGTIRLMGNFQVVDNSTGSALILADYVTSPENIALAIDSSNVLAKEATLNLVKAVTDRLPAGIARNKGKNNFAFLMVLSSDHITPALGKTVSAQKSIDGNAFISCDNNVSEISNGIYKINLSLPDTDGDVITYVFTAPGCDPRYITVVTG